jgi:Domain of unknown function (DUF4470)
MCIVGNTPAKLQTKQVPVHQPIAKVLLLACGDPRHILYTALCIKQAGGLSEKQTLSVMTCDVEWSHILPTGVRIDLERSDFISVYTEIYKRMFSFSLDIPDLSGPLNC